MRAFAALTMLSGLILLNSCGAMMTQMGGVSEACRNRRASVKAEIQRGPGGGDHHGGQSHMAGRHGPRHGPGHHGGSSRMGGGRVNGRYHCVFSDASGTWNAAWTFTNSGGRIIGTAATRYGDTNSLEAVQRGNHLYVAWSTGETSVLEIIGSGLKAPADPECGMAATTCTHR
jgi:hypothetical protein